MDFWAWVSNQRDRAAAIMLAAAGAIAIILGWLGVSRSVLTTQQIPYLASGAVGGIFLLGVAATLWLSADLRDEWRKLDDIHQDIRSGAESASHQPDHDSPVPEAASNGTPKGGAVTSRTRRR